MKGFKRVETGYQPRPLQAKLHAELKRFNVLVMHRRFGKSVFSLNEMLDRALRNPLKNPNYAYLAPLYSQAKRVLWQYTKQYTANIPGAVPNEADLRIDIPRPDRGDTIRLTLLGADNPASLKGIYLDGVILDEYADMNPTVWSEVIRPTLSDRKGWAIFIGTPKGRNGFYELYERATNGFMEEGKPTFKDPEWFAAMHKASETNILAQSELDSAKREMSESEFLQEFECSFNAGLVGAYFAKELEKAETEGRVGNVLYDPLLPVDTYWDLGLNDMTSVWFCQTQRGKHRMIDYYEISGLSIPEIVADIKRKPYAFGEWVFPHDAEARDFSTGRSQLQVFYSLGCRPSRVVPRVGSKRESINAARIMLSQCEFDREKSTKGLKALASYQRKFDQKTQTFSETPLHNWASNGADAFQCFAMGMRESRNTSFSGGRFYDGKTPLMAETDFNPFQRSAE